MPVLKFLNRSVKIDKSLFVIGRSQEGDLILPEPSISRKHAQIVFLDNRYYLEDLASKAGTVLNGTQISRCELRNDDRITLGPFTLVYQDQLPLTPSTELKKTSPDHLNDQVDELIYSLKKEFHQELFNQIDLKKISLDSPGDDDLKIKAKNALEKIIQKNINKIPENVSVDLFLNELLDEIFGLGPLEPFLKDPEITEIMVNGSKQIYIEKRGRLLLTGTRFMGDDQVRIVIERIVHPLGRRIDESSPMVDARLKDGSRVNAIIPPLSLTGPVITIRKFPDHSKSIDHLIGLKSLNEKMAEFLKFCVSNRLNILISGGTGSGKTTLLNILSGFISPEERIITIEDAAELKLVQPHVISLEMRPSNMEGKGLVTIRDLVRNSLRMRPDRIVVGECRGGEAFDMLSAMNTGHEGSLSTIHANSPRDALARLETLVIMAGMELPSRAIRQQISSAIHLVIQLSRLSDGARKITHIVELTGLEGDTFVLQEIYKFKRSSINDDGKIRGQFEHSGLIPTFCDKMRKEGFEIPMKWFE